MKDDLGNELKIGDNVLVLSLVVCSVRRYPINNIVGFTAKMIKLINGNGEIKTHNPWSVLKIEDQ